MPHISDSQLAEMLPRATAWAEMQERRILEQGCSLNQQGIEVARRAGVQHPEYVRLLYVAEIPLPKEADLAQAAHEFGLITPSTGGLTIGHGIFVRQHHTSDSLVAHELKHVAQYENCGSIAAFLQTYLSEVNEHGYPQAPMEQEAIIFAEKEFPAK